MNNILVNSNKLNSIKESGKYFITIQEDSDYTIEIANDCDVSLYIISSNNIKFNIKVSENSKLELNTFLKEGSINLESNLLTNSTFNLNYSIISKVNSNSSIKVNHLGKMSKCNLRCHGFSLNKASIIFDVVGNILKDSSKCIHHQDNQIIESIDSLSMINPILLIDNYDVDASHSAYVGEFKEEELFYLMSRGISLSDSRFLLLKSFLINGLYKDDDFIEKTTLDLLNYYS